MDGLKNRQIAGLVNHITSVLSDKFDLPQSLRQIISNATMIYLKHENLAIDSVVEDESNKLVDFLPPNPFIESSPPKHETGGKRKTFDLSAVKHIDNKSLKRRGKK